MFNQDVTDLKYFRILPTLKETKISTYLNKKKFTELKKLVFSDKFIELNIHFNISSIENVYYFIEVIKDVGPLKLNSNVYHFKFIQNKLNFTNKKEDFKKLPESFFSNIDLKGEGIEFYWRILF